MPKRTKNQSPPEDKALLPQDELFIDLYLDTMNATQAYKLSHPNVNDTVGARVAAHRMLKKENVRAEIRRRMKDEAMSKEEVLKRLSDQARATLYDFMEIEDDGSILFNFSDPEAKKHLYLVKHIKSRRKDHYSKDGELTEEKWMEVELHDSQRALELLGKYHALFTERKEVLDRKTIRVTFKREE